MFLIKPPFLAPGALAPHYLYGQNLKKEASRSEDRVTQKDVGQRPGSA